MFMGGTKNAISLLLNLILRDHRDYSPRRDCPIINDVSTSSVSDRSRLSVVAILLLSAFRNRTGSHRPFTSHIALDRKVNSPPYTRRVTSLRQPLGANSQPSAHDKIVASPATETTGARVAAWRGVACVTVGAGSNNVVRL